MLVLLAALFGERIGVAHEVGIALELRMRLDCLALGEGLDARVAVGAEENADGHIQFLIQGVRERKRQGRETTSSIGSFPAVIRGGAFLRVQRGHGVDVDFAYRNILLGRGEIARQLIAHAFASRPNHV